MINISYQVVLAPVLLLGKTEELLLWHVDITENFGCKDRKEGGAKAPPVGNIVERLILQRHLYTPYHLPGFIGDRDLCNAVYKDNVDDAIRTRDANRAA